MKHFLTEFWYFGIKQAWACLFGAMMLGFLILTHYVDIPGIARYDFLFLIALVTQAALLYFKLETKEETIVICLFHVVGTVMEVFKTSEGVGSWTYPESGFFFIANVPLFSGFMYASVGSYIARVWKIFDFKFTHYPPHWSVALISCLIYLNFFTNHYVWDFRILLFIGLVLIWGRSWIYFRPRQKYYRLPLLVCCGLASFFVWIAENIGTITATWIYPHQEFGWQLVNPWMFTSWFLLMVISFALVTIVKRPEQKNL